MAIRGQEQQLQVPAEPAHSFGCLYPCALLEEIWETADTCSGRGRGGPHLEGKDSAQRGSWMGKAKEKRRQWGEEVTGNTRQMAVQGPGAAKGKGWKLGTKTREEVMKCIRNSRQKGQLCRVYLQPMLWAHLDIVRPPAHPPTMPGTCKYLILHFL